MYITNQSMLSNRSTKDLKPTIICNWTISMYLLGYTNTIMKLYVYRRTKCNIPGHCGYGFTKIYK